MHKIIALIAILLANFAYAAREQEPDYMYYKLRDIENRVDALENRVSKINKKLQRYESGTSDVVVSNKSVVNKTIDEYDNEYLEIGGKEDSGPAISEPAPAVQKDVTVMRIETDSLSTLDLRAAEREFYDDAFAALRENRVERAEKLFLEFMKKFPESGLLSNAHYWLGEIYYSQQKYKDASFHFLSSYQLKPTSSKAPDSVLKMALSLQKLGNNSGACATLIKLIKEFPNMHNETKRRANIEISKLRCDNN